MVKPRRAPWGRASRLLSSAVMALLLVATPASALTLAEIIELSKAGVSDEVLVALIEVDGTPWDLTPERVVELTEAGVSEPVLLALIDAGRAEQPPAAEAPAAETPVYDVPEVTIVPAPPEPAPLPEEPFYADAPGSSYFVEQYETFVPVPVFVDVPDTRRKHHRHERPDSNDRSPDERRHARGRDESRDDDRPERRDGPPRERWARDLPRSGIPASEQPHYRDHSRDLGARDLRALKRAHLDESKDDGSSSGASGSSSDSGSDRTSSSKRRR